MNPKSPHTSLKQIAAVVLALTMFAMNAMATFVVLNANDGAGNNSFDGNSAGHWTPGIAPGPGTTNNTAAFGIRTSTDANNHIFLGDSLTLSNCVSGQFTTSPLGNVNLVLKGTGGSAVACTITNLIMLSGSGIGNANGQNIGAIEWVAGNINVQGNVLMSDVNGAPRYLGIASALSGTGSVTNECFVIYTGNNTSFTGPMVVVASPNGAGGTLIVTNEAALGGNPASFNAAQLLLIGGVFMPSNSFALDHANAGITIGASGGTFNIGAAFTITNSEPFAGTGTLTLNNAGTLLQSGSFASFTGTLAVNAGTFIWQGGSALSSSVSVASGATFDVSTNGLSLASGQTLSGNGTVTGAVTVGGGKISPGGTGVAANLTISSNLTLSGSGTLVYDFLATNDVLIVNSNVSPSGVTSIQLATVPAVGTYTLITAGTLGGSTNNFQVQALTTRNRQYSLAYDTSSTPNRLLLNVTSAGTAANLVWLGNSNNVWDITTTTNWLNGVSSDVYWDGDTANFTDAGATNPPTLNVTVNPGAVIFNSSSNYSLSGTTGAIAGPTAVTKGGTGTLTLSLTNNTYSLGTVVTDGVLQLGFNVASGNTPFGLPSGTPLITVSNTGTFELGGQALDAAYTNAVTINGNGVSTNRGAIDNNAGGLSSGGGDVGIASLNVAGDSTISAAANWQIGNTGVGIIGNGKTLTKTTIGGGSTTTYLYLKRNAASALANFVISGGGVLFWDSPNAVGSTATIILTNGGWIDTFSPTTFNAGLTFANALRVDDPVNGGSIVSFRNTFNQPSPDIYNGSVTLNGILTFSNISFVASNNFNLGDKYGKITMNGNFSGAGGITALGNSANYITSVSPPNGPTYIGGNVVILNGINSYSGPTLVTNLVQLLINTANQKGGSYDVVDFGTLDVAVASGKPTMPMNSLTLEVSPLWDGLPGAGGNLGFTRLSSMPTQPVIYVTNLTINANSAGGGGWILPPVAGYAIGQFPLVKYGSINSGGFNNLALGNLPAGVTASLSNNVGNSSIDLVVSTAGIVWSGTNSPNWDINTSINWFDPTIPGAAKYHDGNGVVFDDTASNHNVVLVQTVAPGGVTINATNNYTLTNFFGFGITGGGALVKNGSGTLNMACTNNNFTGGTFINGGTIKLFDTAFGFPHGAGGMNNSGGNVTVASGATFDINGVQVPNFQTFGPEGYNVFINGSGVGGNGALINSSTANNDIADPGYVTLTSDAAVGGVGDINIRMGVAPQLSAQSSAFTLTKVGTGQFRIRYITAVSTNFGPVNILGGILSFESSCTSPRGFGDATKPVFVGSGAGFAWGPITNVAPCLRTLICSNNSTLYGYNFANNVIAGPVTLDSGNVNLSGVLTVTNGIIDSYHVLVFSNVLSGAGGVTVQSRSRITFAGTNSYSGDTIVANTITNGASNGGSVLSLVGNGSISSNSLHITLQGNPTNPPYAGAIDASGRADATLTLVNGQILRGDNGSYVRGTVVATSGTTVSPGGISTNCQSMTFSNTLTLQSGSTTVMDVYKSSNATNSDRITVTGAATYAGTLQVNTNGDVALGAGDSFQLFSVASHAGPGFTVSGSPGANLVWSFNTNSGVLSVVSTITTVIPTNSATITGFSIAGQNAVLNGTNGQSGGTYYMLSSTNAAKPFNQWTPVATNVVTTNGSATAGFTFTGTNVVTPNGAQQFYILSNTNWH